MGKVVGRGVDGELEKASKGKGKKNNPERGDDIGEDIGSEYSITKWYIK